MKILLILISLVGFITKRTLAQSPSEKQSICFSPIKTPINLFPSGFSQANFPARKDGLMNILDTPEPLNNFTPDIPNNITIQHNYELAYHMPCIIPKTNGTLIIKKPNTAINYSLLIIKAE